MRASGIIQGKQVCTSVCLSVNNPSYKDLINTYYHLNGVDINGDDANVCRPRWGEYAKIKMETCPRVGNDRDGLSCPLENP